MKGSGHSCAAWALTAAILAFLWQLATVSFNYAGKWTALFCTGSRFPVPPSLRGENIYVFADSAGYDGQFYHYIAHDPLLRRDHALYIDAPRLRYRRILIPWLAWMLSGGGKLWLHAAYVAVNLGCVFLGAYWMARSFARGGSHPAWGLVFPAVPATLISLDRLIVDGALAALAAGFVYYLRAGPRWKLCAVLTAAPLVRETGLLLTGAVGLHELLGRRWRAALQAAACALPALMWYGYVHARTAPSAAELPPLGFPLQGFLQRLRLHPSYPFPAPLSALANFMDYLALAGLILAVTLAVKALRRRPDALGLALAAQVLLLTTLGLDFWLDPYGYLRMASPLLVLLIGAGEDFYGRWPLLAALLMLPRVGLQLGPQLLGILRSLA